MPRRLRGVTEPLGRFRRDSLRFESLEEPQHLVTGGVPFTRDPCNQAIDADPIT